MNKDEILIEAKNYVNAFRKEIGEEIKKGVFFETGERNCEIETEE
jgi:hypothetical protein